MHRSLMATLLAATMLVPATAGAQDRGDRWHGDRPARAEHPQAPAPEAAPRPDRSAPRPQSFGGERPDLAMRGGARPAFRPADPAVRAEVDTRVAVAPPGRPGFEGRVDQRVRVAPGAGDPARGDVRDRQQRWQPGTPAAFGRPNEDATRDARDRDGRFGRDEGRGINRDRGDRNGWQGAAPQAWGTGDRDGRARPQPYRNGSDWRDGRRDDARFDARRGWSRDWRQDRRYDWNGYRSANRGVFRLPRYYAPRGWGYGYRRFSIGVSLSPLLFGESYWIGDPGYYRLPPVYGPYRWVRYYDDALLVDIRNGYVVDVVYGIFW